MLTLEELLKEREKRLGESHPAVQMLRDQILAEQSGKIFQELYTGVTLTASKQPVVAGSTPSRPTPRRPPTHGLAGERHRGEQCRWHHV